MASGAPVRGQAGVRTLVTGASGFIGSHVTRRLVHQGHTVHIWTRAAGIPSRLRDVGHALTVHRVDVTDAGAVHHAMQLVRPQRIFHLAAFTTPERDPTHAGEAIDANVRGTLHVLIAALDVRSSLEILINTGSPEEYGVGPAPFVETVREAPVSPYSATKVAATHLGEMFFRSFGLPLVTLRPFLTYGPAQDATMFIPSLIQHCLDGRDFPMTEGTQLREFNYVSDIVEAFVMASERPQVAGQIINVGTGDPHAVADVAERIIEKMGRPITLLRGTIPPRRGESDLFCDNTKARTLLGWHPRVAIEEGLDRTIEWYQTQKVMREVG